MSVKHPDTPVSHHLGVVWFQCSRPCCRGCSHIQQHFKCQDGDILTGGRDLTKVSQPRSLPAGDGVDQILTFVGVVVKV